MKKSTFIIFLILATLNTQAQDYLISFAATGDTTETGTIKVDNLTSGATVTLNGGDLLHLFSTVGVNFMDIANGDLEIYPDPITEQSMLTFTSPESGNAVISIIDLSGKTVYQNSIILSRGKHNFRISGINHGMYFVKVTGKDYTFCTKLISQSNLQRQPAIEYVSSENNTPGGFLKSVAATIDMPYTNGDQLLFKGVSGKYSTIVTDVPASSKTITFNFSACTDNDGNNYTIVQIDAQIWMAENLNVGTRINGSVTQTNNSIIEKYCFDDNDANCAVYGGLYQHGEAMQYLEGQEICPTGWHLPSLSEWTTLVTNLGGENIAGGKIKETGTTHWSTPNTGATNTSGFTALPGGMRESNLYGGAFGGLGHSGFWWSSTGISNYLAWFLSLNYNDEKGTIINYYNDGGFSVRCLRD